MGRVVLLVAAFVAVTVTAAAQSIDVPTISVPEDFLPGSSVPGTPAPAGSLLCTDYSRLLTYRIEYEDGVRISDTIEYGRPFRVVLSYRPCPGGAGNSITTRVRLGASSIFSREFLLDLRPRDPEAVDPRFVNVRPGDDPPEAVDLVSDPIMIAPYGWRGLDLAGRASQRIPDAVAD